jgi:hypothetical protein
MKKKTFVQRGQRVVAFPLKREWHARKPKPLRQRFNGTFPLRR